MRHVNAYATLIKTSIETSVTYCERIEVSLHGVLINTFCAAAVIPGSWLTTSTGVKSGPLLSSALLSSPQPEIRPANAILVKHFPTAVCVRNSILQRDSEHFGFVYLVGREQQPVGADTDIMGSLEYRSKFFQCMRFYDRGLRILSLTTQVLQGSMCCRRFHEMSKCNSLRARQSSSDLIMISDSTSIPIFNGSLPHLAPKPISPVFPIIVAIVDLKIFLAIHF